MSGSRSPPQAEAGAHPSKGPPEQGNLGGKDGDPQRQHPESHDGQESYQASKDQNDPQGNAEPPQTGFPPPLAYSLAPRPAVPADLPLARVHSSYHQRHPLSPVAKPPSETFTWQSFHVESSPRPPLILSMICRTLVDIFSRIPARLIVAPQPRQTRSSSNAWSFGAVATTWPHREHRNWTRTELSSAISRSPPLARVNPSLLTSRASATRASRRAHSGYFRQEARSVPPAGPALYQALGLDSGRPLGRSRDTRAPARCRPTPRRGCARTASSGEGVGQPAK